LTKELKTIEPELEPDKDRLEIESGNSRERVYYRMENRAF